MLYRIKKHPFLLFEGCVMGTICDLITTKFLLKLEIFNKVFNILQRIFKQSFIHDIIYLLLYLILIITIKQKTNFICFKMKF